MKKIIKLIISILILFLASYIIAPPIIFNMVFNRCDKTYEYDSFIDKREEIYIDSNHNKLCLYYYNNNSNNLMVLSHGINEGADDLLNYQKYYYDMGYDILAIDYSGSNKSSGILEGFTKALIDLDYVLNYINNSKLNNKDIYLFGYSMGAYASGAILNIHKNIKAALLIAGFNNSKDIIIEKGIKYVNFFAYIGIPIIDTILNGRFDKYINYNVYDGINNTNTKVFIVNSLKDNIIDYDLSISAYKNKIREENVFYNDLNLSHRELLYPNITSNDYSVNIDILNQFNNFIL